jgi:hypothetical protein
VKATPIQPTGIPRGHVGPLYPAEGRLSTYNHGIHRDEEVTPTHTLRGMYDYAATKQDKQ